MDSDKLTPIGKLFFSSLLASITNEATFIWKLKGTQEQVDDFMRVAKAAKEAYEETKKGDQTTVQTVIDKMNAKQEALTNFEQKYGVKLPI